MKWMVLVCATLVLACTNKKKKSESSEDYFPVHSFLQSQVKDVETNLYRIVRLEKENGKSTTTYIPREAFRKEAAPFLNLPGLSGKDWQENFEESKMLDQDLNKTIFTYTPVDADAEVQRVDVVLQRTADYSNVETIIIHRVQANTVQNMVWYVNKRFTLVNKQHPANAPEKVRTVEVIWNDFTDQQAQ